MIKIKKHRLLALCLYGLPLVGWCQNYAYKATLDPVTASGFYSIPLLPAVAAHVKPDWADIRIMDSHGQNVPHLVRDGYVNKPDVFFVDFPIAKRSWDDSGRTVIILANVAVEPTRHLSLFINNTAAIRYASLSGGNDNLHWYSIKDRFALGPVADVATNKGMVDIDFPLADYKYFKIVIENEGKDPLNVLGAGNSDGSNADYTVEYFENPTPTIRQTDSSNHFTYVRVDQGQAYRTEQILLHIDGPRLYSRTVQVYAASGADTLQGFKAADFLASFNVSSSTRFDGSVPIIKSRIIYLVIDNGDNPPLKITGVETKQAAVDLVTFLEKGELYEIKFGNSEESAPLYDLATFKDSIPNPVPRIALGAMAANPASASTTVIEKPSKRWIWPVIGIVLLLLGGLTWQLTKDLKKEKQASS